MVRPTGPRPHEVPTFRRSNAARRVGRGVPRGEGARVGVLEIANFAKYEVTGAGAEASLTGCSPAACRGRAGSR